LTLIDARPTNPSLKQRAVERSKLLQKLAACERATCVVLQGPAGCGKTSLALQWRAQALRAGLDFAWITAAPGDDPEPLIESVLTALDQVDPQLAREANLLFNQDIDCRVMEPIVIALLRSLAQHQRRIVVLIDDFHLVVDTRIHQLVQMLVDFAPAHLQLALLTRTEPPLSLARLRDLDALAEFGFKDLRFTFAEAEQLLRIEHASLTQRDARQLYDMTDGWAAGLRLVAMAKPHRRMPAALQPDQVQNAADFKAYFHREVLTNLSTLDLDAMSRLSVAPRFCESLCVGLFGADFGQALLARLRRDNLFLVAEADKPGSDAWYRFHPLFRDILKQQFDERPAAQRVRTHATLGAFFGRRQMLRAAVHHCVAAGQIGMGADWLEQHARALFLRGELRRLARAVNELPRSALLSRPSLRLWVAWSELCYRQFDECRQTLESLKATVSLDDLEGRRHLTLLEGSLAIQQDDTEAALRLIPALEAKAPAEDAILAGGRRNILGWLHLEQRNFPAAQRVLGGPRQFLADGQPLLESAFGALVGDALLGLAHLRAGDMRHAERQLRGTLREAETRLGPISEGAVNAAALLSAVLYEFGELKALRAMLAARVELVDRVGLPDAVIYASLTHCRLHRLDGSFQEALADVERMEDTAQSRKIDRLVGHALEQQMLVRIAMGDLDSAEEAVTQLRFLAKRQAFRSSTAAFDVGWRAASARATWLAEIGRHEEAFRTLQGLDQASACMQSFRTRAKIEARKGLLQSSMQRPDEALHSFARAWQLAQQWGLQRSLLDLSPQVLEWGTRACEAGLLDDAARFHLEQVRARDALETISMTPDPMPPHDPLSDRELAIVRALSAALPNKRIGHALGISHETVKWHLKNVYAKLGVYGRDLAVVRARELGYLPAAAV
jgi:LuxR family maltose regulon positive regulatory protein